MTMNRVASLGWPLAFYQRPRRSLRDAGKRREIQSKEKGLKFGLGCYFVIGGFKVQVGPRAR